MAGDSDRHWTERIPCKGLICRSIDNLIAKFPKTPKDNEKQKRTSVSMKGVIVSRKNNPKTVIMITIKIYMHIWHVCMVMPKVLVDNLVILYNGPIGLYIQ